ncbi:MAG: dihydroorotate dehydrogenase electron transfer subunit [Lachnospiraceae bacterium]|nr:dihydroorotate dehydrogenase electron transfer subunit [Lachnospiraceae bacterium]
MKIKENARVLKQEQLAAGIYSLRLKVSFAGDAAAGQFVSLFRRDKNTLLPRPISICRIDADKGEITLVYRVAGGGTAEFSALSAGDEIAVMGPLGNGFPISEAAGKNVLLIGGGIGIPPMLACADAISAAAYPGTKITAAVGFRSADTYLLEEMREKAEVLISTDDGSLGTHGTVLDAIRGSGIRPDIIFACGPKVMLRAAAEFAAEINCPAYVSLEERMACGVGVCLGCSADTTGTDPHSLVKKTRVCADGPVFKASEVVL